MEFRDLKTQYQKLKPEMDRAVQQVMESGGFIGGQPVAELEKRLAEYVGVKHCITCANGTDALQLALMTWKIGSGDAVFVPDFTFFSSAEVIAMVGAVPVFVDVCEDTFNMDPEALENAIQEILKDGNLRPAAVIAVDLFGQPADYDRICNIVHKYDMLLLEDGAQGFGGNIRGKRACSFGDISTTSFFPAKPLGCYGDGGAVFTDNDDWAVLLRSFKVHGKGSDKYDNVRIGMNSRLDTMQAAILLVKLEALKAYELDAVNRIAKAYDEKLAGYVKTPTVKEGFYSSWAQYTILLNNKKERDGMQAWLKEQEIPSMVYYKIPMHLQKAFAGLGICCGCVVSSNICERVLSLPLSPYLLEQDMKKTAECIVAYKKNIGSL